MQKGNTALNRASWNDRIEVVKALLEKGAAFDLQNNVSLLCVLALHGVTQNSVSGLATCFFTHG